MGIYRYKCSHREHGDSGLEFDAVRDVATRDVMPACDDHGRAAVTRLPSTGLTLQPNGSMGDGYFGHIDRRGVEHRGNAEMAGKNRSRWV